jgi:thiol-disulfide isomerase/thioredoxin
MKHLYSFLLIFIFTTSSFCQEDKGEFSVAIKTHLKKHNFFSDIAYEKNDITEGQVLFDSLVYNHLVGTTFDDYTFRSVNKKAKKIKLSEIGKSIFILTYASWCIPSKGEIPALNKLAQKYSKEVKFIVLFWDKKKEAKKISKKFNQNISVCYAHESYKNDAPIVANLKHTLGFPTSYFLDQDLKVVTIKRGGAQPDYKSSYIKAYTMNYNTFRQGLSSLLIEKNINEEKLTTNRP